MKRFILIICAFLLATGHLQAARQNPVGGRVIDSQGAPVAFATVVLLRDGYQQAGTSCDEDGTFSLKAVPGRYTLQVQSIGYQSRSLEVELDEQTDLGDIALEEEAMRIDEVVVTSQLIRREADRFVVDVANSPVAIGKDGVEMLKTAPGIWISDDKISINGKTGSKVYIDDRELKMEPEQMLSYLKGLRAEDIRTIEVFPLSGADYDADSSGGIIKITMRRKRDDGMQGGIYYNTQQGKFTNNHNPYVSLNYHSGKFDFFVSGWTNLGDEQLKTEEHTSYHTSNTLIDAASHLNSDNSNWGGRIGGVYEMNPRHSLGGELNYWHNGDPIWTSSQTTLRQDDLRNDNNSDYATKSRMNNYSATLNYIWKIDTTGSILKVIADYTHRTVDEFNDYLTVTTTSSGSSDSTYRNIAYSRYDIFSLSAAYEKSFSPRWQIKAGGKYTHNKMDNSASYDYLKADAWQSVEAYNYDIDYTEQIAALYAIVNARFGRIGISAGLRAEYTRTDGKQHDVEQNYLSLFPNANISWQLDERGRHSLIASYVRNIQRPNFWSLTPNRLQISDYTYKIGNPLLDPQYSNDVSLTLVLAYKYSLSGGMNIRTDDIDQITSTDPNDPRKLFITWENLPTYNNYYVSVNLPFQLTKWWSWNVNLTAMRSTQQIRTDGPTYHNNMLQGYTMMNFTLPAKFFLECSFYGQTKVRSGTTEVLPNYYLNFSIKKRFWDDRISLSAGVQNVLDRPHRLRFSEHDFVREMTRRSSRTWTFSVSYNFKSGKSFRKRSVESGSSEDQSRL